jgi:hypothetical protein
MEEHRNSVQDKMMEWYDKNYRELKLAAIARGRD